MNGPANERAAKPLHNNGDRMGMPVGQTADLRISRGAGEGPTEVETFKVPYQAGASVLDGLIWIREHIDPSLAFRFSCISANVCKECVIRLDGKTVYACTARLRPQAMTLEPLPNKKRLRDLACDTVPPKERLASHTD